MAPRVPFDPGTDYYGLLGVGPEASVEEIHAAYRRLAKEHHPDLHADSAVAAARMARVNVAKSVLLDPLTRATYDELRASRRQRIARVAVQTQSTAEVAPTPGSTTVRYAPTDAVRARHRVVSSRAQRSAARGRFDKQTGILFVVAVPLIAALVMYVYEAMQISIQPVKPPADLTLAPTGRPSTRGAAEGVFVMLHAQPPSRELAVKANNFILQRSDSSPESEMLRADGRRLVRAANTEDIEAWNAVVQDVCQLAGHC